MTMQAWFEAEYKDIIPIVPPDAKLVDGVNLPKGKCPGKPNPNGEWLGFKNWQDHKTTLRECIHWDESGCSVGLRSKNYPGIDIDVRDENLAEEIEELATRLFGQTLVRIGSYPKRLMMYQTDEPFSKMKLSFEVDDDIHAVEILADGQQYVVEGIHPVTKKAYFFTDESKPMFLKNLPKITADQCRMFLDRLQERLEFYGFQIKDNFRGMIGQEGRAMIDQDSLIATNLIHVAEALDCLPNEDPNAFSFDEFVKIAAAVKAATQKEPESGFDLFTKFAERFPGRKEPGTTRHTYKGVWDRMKPPYAVGAQYLYELASEYGFNVADTYDESFFPAIPDAEIDSSVWTPFSHAWMAEEFIKDYKNVIRAVGEFDRFIIRNGPIWKMDEVGNPFVGDLIRRYAEAKFPDIRNIVGDEEADTIEKTVGTYGWQNSVMRFLLYKHLDLRVTTNDLDSNPDILNTDRGIYCLKTGELIPSTSGMPQDICLKVAGTVPDFEMKTPHWDKFLKEITSGDKEILDYLNTYFGYAMTGHTMEHCFFVIAGKGGNGKSTMLKVLTDVLGDYAVTVPGSVFLQTPGREHPTELMTFQGRRLVVASEFSQRAVWDLGRIKTLTGGDRISARRMHKDFVEFDPTHTIVIAANHKPKVEYVDDAIRRRTRLIPFDLELAPEKKDPDLPDKLRKEYPGILAWLIRGSIQWYAKRLPEIPARVRVATDDYFGESDIVKMWLDDCCILDPNEKVACHTVFESWKLYAALMKESSGSQTSFTESIKPHGIVKKRYSGKRYYKGLRMREEQTEEARDVLFS